MTAPDQVLTDLLAAHTRLGAAMDNKCVCSCSWIGHYVDHPAHVALVVEQHTQTQAARVAEERLAEAIKGMWRLIHKLDETADGLGDWHDATEYVQWARKEVQEIYVRAALEGEQR